MSEQDFSHLAGLHRLGDDPVPATVVRLATTGQPELVWRNELGGMTFRIETGFVKWNPLGTGIDLDRERIRLEWISERHPAPRVLDWGAEDGAQWMLLEALPGEHAVGDRWRARRDEAIRAIAKGLRAIHTIPIDNLPAGLEESWATRAPASIGARPSIVGPVVVHGDACAPNTLISLEGEWTGNVDFGDLAVGDLWADLAIASLSLDWNFGEGHQGELFDAYGIDPDPERIAYYRALWDLES